MKKLLAIILALALVMSLVPAVFAEEVATEDVATERVYTINNTVVDKTIEGPNFSPSSAKPKRPV